jgi:hypothetical protein
MASYKSTDATVDAMVVTTPTEGATTFAELNNAIREIKYALNHNADITTTSGATSAGKTNSVIFINGAHTVTLPQSSTVAAQNAYQGATKWYYIRNIHASSNGTIKTFSSEKIDGTDRSSTGLTLPAGESRILATNGTDWFSLNLTIAHDHSDAANGGAAIGAATITGATLTTCAPSTVSGGTPDQDILYSESFAKAWVIFNQNADVASSYNVDDVTKDGTGIFTIAWDRNFDSVNYVTAATVDRGSGSAAFAVVTAQVAASVQLTTLDTNAVAQNPESVMVVAYGAQAA